MQQRWTSLRSPRKERSHLLTPQSSRLRKHHRKLPHPHLQHPQRSRRRRSLRNHLQHQTSRRRRRRLRIHLSLMRKRSHSKWAAAQHRRIHHLQSPSSQRTQRILHLQSPKKPEDSKDPSPPESKPQDSAEEDLLEFTSATEGEGEASSSAWELVPNERKIARKKGVKSDSEIDSLVKKVIKEANSRHQSPPRRSPPRLPPPPKTWWLPSRKTQQLRQQRKIRGLRRKRLQLRSPTGSQTSVLKTPQFLLQRTCSPPRWAARTS